MTRAGSGANGLGLGQAEIDRLHPFWIGLDNDLRVVARGSGHDRRETGITLGERLLVSVRLDRRAARREPRTLDDLLQITGAIFLVNPKGLKLRGAAARSSDAEVPGVILCSPFAPSSEDLKRMGFSLLDLPPHDLLNEMLLILSSRDAALHDARGLATRLRGMSDAAEKDQRRAEQASRAKSRFLSSVGHELRTPMNALMGALDQLESGAPDASSQALSGLRTAAESLGDRVDDLTEYAAMDRGGVTLDTRSFTPLPLIEQVLGPHREHARDRNLGFEVRIESDELPMVRADRRRLKRVLDHLLSNAIRHTERGHVAIRISAVFPPDDQPAQVSLVVSDTGCGIDPQVQARMFEAFETIRQGTDPASSGLGLGLSISRALIETMHGTVSIHSVVGEGTSVEVLLPAEPSSHQPSHHNVAGELSFENLRLLVVEDNAVNRTVMRSILEKAGSKVRLAEDGMAGWHAAVDTRFHAILMDIRMPVMDGIESTRRIRAEEASRGLPRTPIIAVTGNATAEDRAAAFEAGMDEFLTKPVRAEVLEETLVRILAKSTA